MATLNKKYFDYTILSKPRFKSGVAVIDKAVEKGAQPRNTKRYRKYNQPTVASPAGLKEALKARQRKLADAGYYKGKIDGIWGKQSKAAQAAYDKANGKHGETVFDAISRNYLNAKNLAKNLKTTSKNLTLEDLTPVEKKLFAEWLFSQGGSENTTRGKLGNVMAGVSNWLENSMGIPGAIISHLPFMEVTKRLLGVQGDIPGITPFATTDGMKKQIVALHLYDDKDILKLEDGTIRHSLGYDTDGTYKWQQLNGRKDTNNTDRNLFDRASSEPGTYNLGKFGVIETPTDIQLKNDYYNFNPEGTERAKKIVESGNADSYNRLRYYTGEYGVNRDIPVDISISKDNINSWVQLWKNQK